MDNHMQSTNQSYAPSTAEYANAEAGPSNYASPPASAGRLQALAPVRASGEDDSSGVVILPTEPNVFTDKQLEEYKEQDRYLPIANVGRIMKNSLPDSAKIAKEAKECVQECVSEFISFLSSEAADKVQADKRKTINGEDILYSMSTLGFDNYAEACKVYLAKYRHYVNEHQPSRVHSRDVSPQGNHDPDGAAEEGSALETVNKRTGGKRARPPSRAGVDGASGAEGPAETSPQRKKSRPGPSRLNVEETV